MILKDFNTFDESLRILVLIFPHMYGNGEIRGCWMQF